MQLKTIYLLLCPIGVALPYSQFVPWLSEHGFDLSLFVQQLFANRISAFFGVDVFLSAAVLILFIKIESSRLRIRRWWIPVLALCAVGVSFSLPMFLYMRELSLERDRTSVR